MDVALGWGDENLWSYGWKGRVGGKEVMDEWKEEASFLECAGTVMLYHVLVFWQGKLSTKLLYHIN